LSQILLLWQPGSVVVILGLSDILTLTTTCCTQGSRRWLLYKPSHSRVGLKFRCHGNQVRSS